GRSPGSILFLRIRICAVEMLPSRFSQSELRVSTTSTFTCSQYGLLSVSVEPPPDLDENIEHPASSKIPSIEQKRITSDPLIKPKTGVPAAHGPALTVLRQRVSGSKMPRRCPIGKPAGDCIDASSNGSGAAPRHGHRRELRDREGPGDGVCAGRPSAAPDLAPYRADGRPAGGHGLPAGRCRRLRGDHGRRRRRYRRTRA